MPAWPVNASCEALKKATPPKIEESLRMKIYNILLGDKKNKPLLKGGLSTKEKNLLTAMFAGANVYFNYTKSTPCTNISDVDGTGSLDGYGWNVLACNQLAMTDSVGNASMFLDQAFNQTEFTGKLLVSFLMPCPSFVPGSVQLDSPVRLRLRLLRRKGRRQGLQPLVKHHLLERPARPLDCGRADRASQRGHRHPLHRKRSSPLGPATAQQAGPRLSGCCKRSRDDNHQEVGTRLHGH